MADGTGVLRRDGHRGEIDLPFNAGSRQAAIRRLLLIAGPVLLVAVAGLWWLLGGRYVSTDDAYVQANTVAISTDVSGTVSDLYVSDNENVKAGQVLFSLDSRQFQIALDRAVAQVSVARTNIDALKAQYREREQEIQLAQVNGDFANREFTRANALFASHVVSQDQLDRTRHDLDAARQEIVTQQQQLAMILASLDGNTALPTDQYPQVQEAEAAVAAAQRDLDHSVVRAPTDGVVSKVPNIRPGSYLAAGTPAFALVSIDESWIEANLKETQLTWVRPGQPVEIDVDTYPGVAWKGHVASVSPASGAQFSVLPAENATGNWVKVVQRIAVRVAVETSPDQPPLRAGMSAEITIDTGHRPHLPHFLSFLAGN